MSSGSSDDMKEFIDLMFEFNGLFGKIKAASATTQTMALCTIGLQIRDYTESPEFEAALKNVNDPE